MNEIFPHTVPQAHSLYFGAVKTMENKWIS